METVPVRLGLRANWQQFALLVVVNAFVGAMVGMERAILPLLAEQEFGLASRVATLSFVASFGLTSRPTRARGLKPQLRVDVIGNAQSRPTRARGLKLSPSTSTCRCITVAPHAGAWIETCKTTHRAAVTPVAPHAGAWIET